MTPASGDAWGQLSDYLCPQNPRWGEQVRCARDFAIFGVDSALEEPFICEEGQRVVDELLNLS